MAQAGDLLERLGVERPIVQAGMGGGLAGHELAAAVSGAGGLGTIGILAPDALRREIALARETVGGDAPLAVNLLLPFTRDSHWEAVSAADAVFTFWGRPRRRTEKVWIHQCGSVEEARAARDAGADAVIAQGVEAGGHVRGTIPALELLERTRAALGPDYPVLVAGGIADGADVRAALDAGAEAAVLGTRFLMTPESRALTAYKQRLTESRETVLTELFGAGWPRAPHRVIWNEAAERWLGGGGSVPGGGGSGPGAGGRRSGEGRPGGEGPPGSGERPRGEEPPRGVRPPGGDVRPGPAWVRALHVATAPLLARVPLSKRDALARRQRAGGPLLGPLAAVQGGPSNLLDAGPLYAGESVARIHDLRPAAELVSELAR